MRFLGHLSWRAARAGVRARQKNLRFENFDKNRCFLIIGSLSYLQNSKRQQMLKFGNKSKIQIFRFQNLDQNLWFEFQAKFGFRRKFQIVLFLLTTCKCARHRIEHHQSNILCIYNMLKSAKLAEIDRFENFRQKRFYLRIREKKVPPLTVGCQKFPF